MPAYHEQWVSCGQRREPAFPTRRPTGPHGSLRRLVARLRGQNACSHVSPQRRGSHTYSTWLTSALPDPAEPWFGHRLRVQMLAVAPGTAWALLMVLLTARRADHNVIVPRY
jgi:hypothetical protein